VREAEIDGIAEIVLEGAAEATTWELLPDTLGEGAELLEAAEVAEADAEATELAEAEAALLWLADKLGEAVELLEAAEVVEPEATELLEAVEVAEATELAEAEAALLWLAEGEELWDGAVVDDAETETEGEAAAATLLIDMLYNWGVNPVMAEAVDEV